MITPSWASLALLIPAVLAQSTTSTSTTSAATPSCTASLITKLCSYPEPGPEFAVASESRASCWRFCDAHPPCDFVIFYPGNPTLGSGTCWLYPGQSFDESKGDSDCGSPYLDVYDKPECTGSPTTTTTGTACTATETPSAIASVCGYPTPPGECFDGCTASLGATNCLSQCANSDSCSYVVFNPHNPSNSPYASGTCWMYPSGEFQPDKAEDCSGDPEQFVYENSCPKPVTSSSSSASVTPSASSSTESPGGTGVSAATTEESATEENSASGGLDTGTGLLGVAAAGLIWRAV